MRQGKIQGRAWAAAGVAGALAWLPGAFAGESPPTPAGAAPAEHRAHESKPVLFSADDVTYDDQLDIVTARGNVEMSQNGRTLLADVVSYNQRSDTVIASGNVSLIEEATGETTFGNYVELHDSMRDGFIKDVRMLMADRSRLAGNTARRTDANRTELMRGVYSPCDLCKTDPSAPPVWQIRAAEITHDKADQLLEFYDASLEIEGIPAFWLPYMSHPDPTVKRRSGFLPPTVGNNSVLGLYADVPYYWAIDTDKDLTITPFVTSLQSVMLEQEYRQRFNDGYIDIIGSIADSDPDPSPTGPPNPSVLRGDLFGKGEFDLTANLRAGFDVERVSDIIYLQEYKLGAYQNFLTSSADLENFDGRDYGSMYAYTFQSLQSDVENRIQPVVLPVIDYIWAGRPLDWGGRFTTSLDVLDLVRETGPSDRRISVGEEFDLPFTVLDGQRFNLVGALRADGYYASSVPLAVNGPLTTATTGRAFPQIGLEWRYPWVYRHEDTDWIIEPRAAVYAAPVGMNPSSIPNDDSEAVDFNDTDLFNRNRFVGFDQVDSGQRVDYGMHLAWKNGTQQAVDMLVGQSYRFQQQSPFAVNGQGDGLEHRASDYVGRVTITPGPYLDIGYHFRLDEQDLRPMRQELSVGTNVDPVHVAVSYQQIGENLHDAETARQQIGTQIKYGLDTYWSIYASGTRDITGDGHLLAAEIGATYIDECTNFTASVGTDGIVIESYKPGTTVMLQLILKNLGIINLPLVETTIGQ
jgi:LPS-assembly protein